MLLPGEKVVIPRQEDEPEWVIETWRRSLFVAGDPACPHDFPPIKVLTEVNRLPNNIQRHVAWMKFVSTCLLCPAQVGQARGVVFDDNHP